MILVEERNQDLRPCRTNGGMGPGVGRVRGGIADLGKPIGISLNVWVPVRSGCADRGHRAPKIVGIFRIVEGDDRVGKTQIEQRKQASVLRGRQIMRQRRGLCDLVPVVLNSPIPKTPGQGWSAVAVVLS